MNRLVLLALALLLGQLDVLDEGVFKGRTRSRINCSGDGVTCSGPDGGTMTITVSTSPDGGSHSHDYIPFLTVDLLDAGQVIVNNELSIPQMEFASFPPAATSLGRIILDLTSGVFRWSDGSQWLYAVPGSPDGGPLNVYVVNPSGGVGVVSDAGVVTEKTCALDTAGDECYLPLVDGVQSFVATVSLGSALEVYFEEEVLVLGGSYFLTPFMGIHNYGDNSIFAGPGINNNGFYSIAVQPTTRAARVKLNACDSPPCGGSVLLQAVTPKNYWLHNQPRVATQGASRDGGLAWPVALWAVLPDAGAVAVPASHDGYLGVDMHSDAVVSSGNSTTATLGSNATFTGSTVDISDYSTIRVSLYADKASATNGFKLQFSNDGTNWDFVRQTTIGAGETSYPTFNRIARFFRVVYTNGAVAQTAFRLQTLLIPNSTEFSRVFTDETPSGNTSAVVTSSMIYGLSTAGGGSYVQVKVSPSGALNVASASQSCTAASRNSATSVGTSSTSVPASALASRQWIALCNSKQNASTAILKCKHDGAVDGDAGNPGDVLGWGDCATYLIGDSATVRCIANAASTYVQSYECL